MQFEAHAVIVCNLPPVLSEVFMMDMGNVILCIWSNFA